MSSEALAQRGGTTSAQVRKDLSFFGSFGKRGLGYPGRELRIKLRGILGLGRRYPVVVVRDGAHLERELRHERADIAAVVTPAEAAQEVADRLVACGVTAILNFAPVQLKVPERVVVRTVNLVLELEALSYLLANR